jgi:hypothetical protein
MLGKRQLNTLGDSWSLLNEKFKGSEKHMH